MTENEFLNLYWKQYLLIEKEFKATTKYAAIDRTNFSTFSDAYAKILLQVGSEVDVISKQLCKEINSSSNAQKIDSYGKEIIGCFPEFENVTVSCDDIDLQPWNGWATRSPQWWKIYNGVKHNRNEIVSYNGFAQENFRFANQEVTLRALAGLFQEEQYLYTVIQHDPHMETPLPGSRLFRLKDQGWEKKQFGLDTLFYIHEGCLYYMHANFTYSDL